MTHTEGHWDLNLKTKMSLLAEVSVGSEPQPKWSGGILPDPWLVEALRSAPGEASLSDEAGERGRSNIQT